MSQNIQQDVADFHRTVIQDPVPTQPQVPSDGMMFRRGMLIDEEYRELKVAMASRSLPAMAQEAVDLVYVVEGLLVECGVDFQKVWDAVHAANMQKRPGPPGGKAVKPPGWRKPDIKALLESMP